MNITDRLNSGAIHAAARHRRAECVDRLGNIHGSAERARFVNWRLRMAEMYGNDVSEWPPIAQDEYRAKYVPA